MIEELRDFRLRVILRVKEQNERVDVDARLLPVKEAIGRQYGLFYIDFQSFRIEIGQDLLDEIFEEMIWFVSPGRVKEVMKEWSERSGIF
ncbi:MAG: hypothetical protein QW540_09125 [Archaeoglobaceae archaeon]